MKRIIFFVICSLCLLPFTDLQAQRYLPDQRGLQLTVGPVNGLKMDQAFHVGAAYSRYNKHKHHWIFGGEYLEKRYSYKGLSLPQAQFTMDGGFYFKFLSDASKTLFLSVGASALAGYETINRGISLLPDGALLLDKNTFLYGAAVTLEAEIYIVDQCALLLNIRERLTAGSTVGRFNTQIGLGIKFIIN